MFDIGWLLQHKTSCCISDRCKSLLSTKTSSHTVRMHHDEIFPGFMHIKIESRIRQLNSGLFVCRTLNLLQQCKNYSKLIGGRGAGDRGLIYCKLYFLLFTFYASQRNNSSRFSWFHDGWDGMFVGGHQNFSEPPRPGRTPDHPDPKISGWKTNPHRQSISDAWIIDPIHLNCISRLPWWLGSGMLLIYYVLLSAIMEDVRCDRI